MLSVAVFLALAFLVAIVDLTARRTARERKSAVSGAGTPVP
jgi:hypothetical protein